MNDGAKQTPQGGMMQLLNDNRGNIMPMAAIGMVAMAGMIGGGVDISRAYMVQNRLQNACDSAVLAGRRAVVDNGFDTAAQAQAEDYFDTNFNQANEGTTGTTFTPTTPDNGNQVDGVATTTVDNVVMGLFGFENINLSVACSASMSVGNSDVVMVLDTTGSMDWTIAGNTTTDDSLKRITSLRSAMKNFYDTVEAAKAGTNARIRYGFVPYSTSANVGELLTDISPNYIVEKWTYQSREPIFEVEEQDSSTLIGYEPPYYENETSYGEVTYSSWYYDIPDRYYNPNSCRNAKPADTSWANNGSSSTSSNTYIDGDGRRITATTVSQPQRRAVYECVRYGSQRYYIDWRYEYRNYNETEYAIEDPIYETTETTVFDKWLYKEVEYNTASYRNFNSVNVPLGTDGANISTTWEGCIEERSTVAQDTFSYSSILGMTPSDAYDLDIDSAPDSSDPDTQWRPVWEEVSYYRTSDDTGYYYTSNAESDFGRKSFVACPVKSQLLTAMTETEFDAYADSLSPEGSTYHDVGMIWGARLSSPTGIFASNVTEAPANGGAVSRHIIFMTDGQMSPSTGSHTAYGVEYHDRRVTDNGYSNQSARHSARFLAVCEATKAKGIRVWVIAFASALTTNLESCASTDSAFTASNSSQLNSAFQEIAKNVGELRVIQ